MEKLKKKRLDYSLCQTMRIRWNITQAKLAAAAGVTQADISEMENYTPYGQMDKYQRVAGFFGIPVDAIIRNDFRLLAGKKLNCPQLRFAAAADTEEKITGRIGEELAYEMERERVSLRFPGLEELIIPYFKLSCPSPGFDILSFDDEGQPVYMEVKTTCSGARGFRFTAHELHTAREYNAKGLNYVVRNILDLGSEDQRVLDLPFRVLESRHVIRAQYYWCHPKPQRKGKISGLAYFRELRGLKQAEFSELMGITQTQCSLCETGARKPEVDYYLRAAEILETGVEELLREYERPAEGEGEHSYGN